MGVFDGKADVFTTYFVELRLRDRLIGGTPKNPKLIEGWLRSKAGISDEDELLQAIKRTLTEQGVEVAEDATFEQLVEASERIAHEKTTNGFKLDDALGLYIESRQIKAMLKENTNILFAGERWGKTKKGPKSFVAERVFVNPDRLYLDRKEPDSVELMIGQVSGPQGKRSVVGYYESVAQPMIEFELMVAEDAISMEQWAQVWVLAQENGLGALRSQGFGRFDITRFDKKEGQKKAGRKKK